MQEDVKQWLCRLQCEVCSAIIIFLQIPLSFGSAGLQEFFQISFTYFFCSIDVHAVSHVIMCYCVSVLLYLPAITCNWLIQLQEFIRNFEEHGYTRFDFIWGMTIEVSVWDRLE